MASVPSPLTVAALMMTIIILGATTEAQQQPAMMTVLNEGCSQYNATDLPDFFSNFNATMSDIGAQLREGSKKFATAQQARGSDPVYAMAQCRNYLSTEECSACFAAADRQIRNCSAANGARVIYDDCFLRYESNSFFDQTTLPGNVGICGKQVIPRNAAAFTSVVEAMLSDLLTATPRITGFFAATKMEFASSNSTAYGVAQCAETVSSAGCAECLGVAYTNLMSCLPDANGRAVDAGCFLRYSDTSFFPDNQTTNLALFLKSGGSKKKAIIGGVAGGVGGVILVALVAFFIWFKKSRASKFVSRGDILGATELQGPVIYSYKDLKASTDNFSQENKLGEGGFGDVFKGTLKNGKTVAVKRLAIGQSQRAKEEFDSEVKLISNVHHRNLVRLLGCSNKGPELLLVYEFMANTSLDRFLFGQRRGSLNWKQRHNIITGTAQGLNYLHEEFHVCIIHRDIKTSNILLDEEFNPRIADFGLARLLPDDQTHLSTRFAGTLGYTAPEYSIHGQLSEKADVYSYGVVVLEIISGQKCNEVRKDDPAGEYLLERAWKLYEKNSHLELVDETMEPEEYEAETAKKIIEIAIMCVQSSPIMRPTMSEVVVLLKSKVSSSEPLNLQRPVFVDANYLMSRGETSSSMASSNATASVSRISGR